MEYKQRPRNGNIDGFIAAQPRRRRPIQPSYTATKPLILPTPVLPDQSFNRTYTPTLNAVGSGRPTKLKSQINWKKRFKRITLVCLALLLITGGWLGSSVLGNLDKVFHGNVLSDAAAAFNSKPLKGESSGRVNILLAGDSSDDPNHGGAQLTDSILLLSIDTQNHTAFLLSIPRDLWVNIPELNSYQKINAANDVTKFSEPGYPAGGMGQLEQIIETQLNIPIDYYGLMDYGAFQSAVNAVGGVTINIQSSDPRGLYDPNVNLKLPNGLATLNGQQALNLARARGDGYGSYGFPDSDFDRTAHQRQLFTAVAEKAKTIGVLTNPIKISDLFGAFGNNFQTDLSLQNVLRLVQITKGINLSSIQSYAFSSTLSSTNSDPLLENYTDPASGETALIPSAGIGDYGQLQQYYQQLTSNNPVVKESPSVVILNASDVIGLASKQRAALQAKGFNVAAIADANNEYPTTMIVDNSNGSKPNSLKLLQQQYPGTTVTSDKSPVEATEAQNYTADFVVVLGQNWDSSATQ
jgi:LCP family protein required for cell wall assembly